MPPMQAWNIELALCIKECLKWFWNVCGRSTHWLQGTPDHGVVTTLNQFVLACELRVPGVSVLRAGLMFRVYVCVESMSHERYTFLLILVERIRVEVVSLKYWRLGLRLRV